MYEVNQMPRPRREGQWKTINLQISADLYNQVKERADIKGQTMTMTLERILSLFFKNHPNDGLQEDA